MGVIFGEGLQIKAMGVDQDFSAALVPRIAETPAVKITHTLPDVTVEQERPATLMTFLDVVVVGNTKELQISSTRPDLVSVEGATAYKKLDYAPSVDKVYVNVSTEYGARNYLVNIPEDTPPRIQSKAGTYVAGSFGAQVTALMRAEFDGVTQGAEAQDLFLDGGTYTADTAPASVTVNPTRTLQGMDMSCVSVSRSNVTPGSNDRKFPVELVSPRHAVCNIHCGVWAGVSVCFRQRSGTIQTVTVLGHIDLSQDLQVVMFDQDVTDCAFCVTLPSDIQEYAPGSTRAAYDKNSVFAAGAIPVVVRHSNPGKPPERFLNNYIGTNSPHLRVQWVRMWQGYNDTTTLYGISDDPLYPYHNPGYGGDSGSPVFLLIPQPAGGYAPALLTSLHSADSGPSYPHRRLDVNAAMAALSSTYGDPRVFEMGTVSLNHFPRFSMVT